MPDRVVLLVTVHYQIKSKRGGYFMACFIVTATEALVVSAVEKFEAKKEVKSVEAGTEVEAVAGHELTHLTNKDSLLMYVAYVFVGAMTMVGQYVLRF